MNTIVISIILGGLLVALVSRINKAKLRIIISIMLSDQYHVVTEGVVAASCSQKFMEHVESLVTESMTDHLKAKYRGGAKNITQSELEELQAKWKMDK